MRRVLPLVVLAVAFVAGCGQSNPELIPQSNADAMLQAADAIQAACEAEDRSEVRRQIRLAQREIEGLPSATDDSLRENLQAWVKQIEDRVSNDCRAEPTATAEPTETATPEDTATAEPTETATPEDTATPEPTETATPEDTATPEPTTTAAPTEPPVETATPEVP